MHIAVAECNAAEGESFVFYVDELAKAGYVPPKGRAWVDVIRKKANEATHELPEISDADATNLLGFAEMLLKFVYEYPNRVTSAP